MTTRALTDLVIEMRTRGLTYEEHILLLRAIERDLENHIRHDDDLDGTGRVFLDHTISSVRRAQGYLSANRKAVS